MNDFSKDDLEKIAFCVASYTDHKGDTIYGELLNKIMNIMAPDCMTQKQIDYYNLLEEIRRRF